MLSAIVAVGRNGEIGQGGSLPWPRLPADMKWFRACTLHKPVIMGRKTWESLPNVPLPSRENIVMTRKWPGVEGPVTMLGCDLVKTPEAAVRAAEDYRAKEAVVIGGAAVYRAMMPLIDRIWLTRIDAEYPDADSFFPCPLPAAEWDERPCYDRWFADAESGLRMGFYEYSRRPRIDEPAGVAS
jgi:dihydrofolate reductase